jgi:hypothetical protein
MGRFHLANPADLDGLQEWTEWLEAILHGPCSIAKSSGKSILVESKQCVDKLDGLRIDIYPDEHPPPHFHVKSPEVNASFAIDDGRLLTGTASPSAIRKIKYWHSLATIRLIEVWDSTRPTGCTVGAFRS